MGVDRRTRPQDESSTTLRPDERRAWLALLPLLATAVYYLLPDSVRQSTAAQFAPQVVAYAALWAWAAANDHPLQRLGLHRDRLRDGLRWGLAVGLLLGLLNSGIILWLVPRLGWDITFLRTTPHAQIPPWIMVPWFILAIAVGVECNFRGFQLGRLCSLASSLHPHAPLTPVATRLIVSLSALTFAFDPFMTATFQHLHWIAVWDGIVWGLLWIRQRNLVTTIVAHAVEVILLYSLVRAALTP